jgi:hypothetical protein
VLLVSQALLAIGVLGDAMGIVRLVLARRDVGLRSGDGVTICS